MSCNSIAQHNKIKSLFEINVKKKHRVQESIPLKFLKNVKDLSSFYIFNQSNYSTQAVNSAPRNINKG